MQTQNRETMGGQPTGSVSGTARGHGRRGFAIAGALLVVVLLVAASAFILSLLAGRRGFVASPPAGQWKQVYKGYVFTSLVTARSNPTTLYACVTRSQAVSSQDPATNFTVLLSTDTGETWQDVGKQVAPGDLCSLVVNPTNSNDVYVLSVGTSPLSSAVLKHSLDGGQTWEVISPRLVVPGLKTAVQWNVQQIQFQGNRLFGVQVLPLANPAEAPQWRGYSSHLVYSLDQGRTWTVMDSRLSTGRTPLLVRSYAVDPVDTNTVYELVGPPFLPVQPVNPPVGGTTMPGVVQPGFTFGITGQLYKTSNGGASWDLLLHNLAYGARVELASAAPDIVYVGGFSGPLPLAAVADGSASAPAGFHMQISRNAGKSWLPVSTSAGAETFLSWFVSPAGLLYLSPFAPNNSGSSGSSSGSSGPGVSTTVLPVTPVGTSTGPKYGGPPQKTVPPSVVPSSTTALPVIKAPPVGIQRYDPTTAQWSVVAQAPAPGTLLTLTPATGTGSVVLWYVGEAANAPALYRYIVG